MDIVSGIIIAIISSTGVSTLVQFLINRHDNKKTLAKTLARIEISEAQTHLLLLIEHYPTNHKAILSELEYYFGTLHGDSWVWGIASEWGKEQKVNIEYLEALHLQNIRRN